MVRRIETTLSRIDREEIADILGGAWLVVLLMGLLQLPNLLG